MERKLTAIFSAGVKGYSYLTGEDEEAIIRTLTAYRKDVVVGSDAIRRSGSGFGGQEYVGEFTGAWTRSAING